MNLPTASEPLASGGPGLGGWDRDVVVRLENVSVQYRVPRERITSFKEYAIRTLQRRVSHEEFWALRDVSLEVRDSETFGIIGRNGAGKSTLLKVVSRVLRPSEGRVWVRGRVAPLLELGAGFHGELTGRENVLLNGALLGYSKAEMVGRFDDIVDFAEIWDFIDAPLRMYSSGMITRLGFAVATADRPDILILDETLAVGDEGFQDKCKARIEQFRRQGTTTMIVMHGGAMVREMCDRVAWLQDGRVCALGHPDEVTRLYSKSLEE